MFRKILYTFSFYFTRRFYIAGSAIATLFVLAFFFEGLQQIASIALICLSLLVFIDIIVLFINKPITASRICVDRFSNGDENKVTIIVNNYRPYKIKVHVIDELPFQFQNRNHKIKLVLNDKETLHEEYTLRPIERGEYHFGIINLFVYGPVSMLIRHIKSGEEKTVAVYPSYLQMKRFQLMAVTNQLQDAGTRRLRKIGQSLEFEQIKDYVPGDDYRTINWKATARKTGLMVNSFMDERSQQVICLIDKGRSMKMPFDGMSLLDYAINASLVLSNIVLMKQDKAGLLTFSKKIDQYVAADKRSGQIPLILETLYKQQTDFKDSDFEALYSFVRYRIKHRSLLVLFTNFESIYSMERQLPYLKQLAMHHPLLVIFFENTELLQLQQDKANTLEQIYQQAIANKFALEKRQIVKELQKHGIMTLLTPPKKLTANTINKYFEIKARQVM